MRISACVLALIMLGGVSLRSDEGPDLTKLRAAYNAKLADSRNKLAEIYLDDLQRLRDSYVRAGKANLAKEVDAEIDSIRRRDISLRDELPPATPAKAATAKVMVGSAAPPDPQWFVGKKWVAENGLKWSFGNDGISGEKLKAGKKVATFTWKMSETGVLELTERGVADKPTGITYIRFANRSQAWAGGSAEKLTTRLQPE